MPGHKLKLKLLCHGAKQPEVQENSQVLVILHLFEGLTEKGETSLEHTLRREMIITLLLAAFTSVRWFPSTQAETLIYIKLKMG